MPILLLSPAPAASSDDRTDRLAPIVWWGSGEPAGTLFTASTRRPGLVLNTDVLATLAERLKLPLPPGATGRPFHSDQHPVTPFRSHAHRAFCVLPGRPLRRLDAGLAPAKLPRRSADPAASLAAPRHRLAALLIARHNAERRPRLHRLVGAIASLVITLPLGMLVLPLLNPSAPWMAEALLAALMLTVGLFAAFRPHAVPALFRLLSGLLLLLCSSTCRPERTCCSRPG